MKKLLLIFLLAVLPFQFAWAAAAAYCQHDSEKAAQHFGHHAHQHDANADLPDDTDKVVKVHADCGYCHLACQVSFLSQMPELALPTEPVHAALPLPSYYTHIPDGLHRPDWRLAA